MKGIARITQSVTIGTCALLSLVVISLPASAQQKLSFTKAIESQYTLPVVSSNSLSAKSTAISVTGSVEVIGTPSAVRDRSGNIHILFTDKVAGDQIVLRYLRQKGTAWESAEIDKLGSASYDDGRLSRGLEKQIPSVVIDNGETLHYTYYLVESNSIKLYYGSVDLSQGMATKTLVETITSNTSYQNGLAIDKQNVVHISYHNEGLMYANSKSGCFSPTMLVPNKDSKPDLVERGVNSTMLILPNGNILIPYQGTHHRNWAVVAEFLDCQVYADGVWKNVGIVGSLGTINTNGFNVFMDNGTPTLVYYAGGVLGFAQYTERWSKTTVGLGSETLSSSLTAAIVSNSKPVVAWYSRKSSLYTSFRNGDSWTTKKVDGVEQHGDAFPVIVPSANGKVEVFVRANVQGKGTIVKVSER